MEESPAPRSLVWTTRELLRWALQSDAAARTPQCCLPLNLPPPHLRPAPPSADKLEAANAERPGFFSVTKKIL